MGLLTGSEGRVVRVIRGGVAVLAAAVLVAGCGTGPGHGGGGSATSSSAAGTSSVDLSALDVGNYPTKPQPGLEAAGTPLKGLIAEFIKQVTAMQTTPADPVKGLPGSTCLQVPGNGYYCTATADRYAIEAQSEQVRDAHQLLAAQYALLVAK